MRKKTHQEFISDMNIKMPHVSVIGEYLGSKTKITVKCKTCGYTWKSRPNNLLTGYGCPKCSNRHKRTNNEFRTDVKIVNPDIEIISDFTNTSRHVQVKCKVCDYIWSTTPNHLLSGSGCPNCKAIQLGDRRRLTNEEFLKRLKVKNKNVDVLSKYTGALNKVKCKCKICNNIWYITPANLLDGHGCSICNNSKGEKEIYSYLIDNDVKFETQKKFNNLFGVNNGLLSYDFYLPNQNLLIEFQGLQHEKPVDFKGLGNKYAESRFIVQKEHDKRKREYAEKNHIRLLEVWYFEFDKVKEILNKNINLILERKEKNNEVYTV